MLRITSEAVIAQITSAASKPALTQKGYKNFFRVNSKDDDYGPAMGQFIAQDLKAKNVYVLNSKNTYCQGLSDQVVAGLNKGNVKYTRATVVEQAKDYSSVLTTVKAQNPDVVFVAVMDAPDHAAIVTQMRSLGIKAVYVGSEGAKDLKDFVHASEGKAEGAYMFHMAPDIYSIPAAANYVKQFESKYGSLSGWGPTAYEAANILLDAMEKAAADGKISRDEVVNYVRQTSHSGILGSKVEFNASGDLKSPATYIFKVVKGNFKQVKVVAGR
jgi:branched-chain amino acid transport system substrate-binding protein